MRSLGIGRLERLPFSREEALALQELRHRSGDVLPVLDFAANRQVLEDERWRRAPILHFATHGLLDDRQAELSGLVFSLVNPDGSPRPDGFLPLHEIYGLDLDAELVVLSACQTGSDKGLRGEGLLGLTRGFMSLGVPQLVINLWKVEDQATAELMRRFYKELFNGYRPPEALQRAQTAMLHQENWSDPSLWSGFIFMGDFERRPGGGIEARDTGGSDSPRGADSGGLPPPKVKPKAPKRERRL
jgi:CHAT domain-containing protein